MRQEITAWPVMSKQERNHIAPQLAKRLQSMKPTLGNVIRRLLLDWRNILIASHSQ
ncbi:MAG TPA: hypothetical protein PKC48_08640 [Sphingorhabdus sp.]|nr:hypothetical protein [Sphingorhabdus sp.]